MSDVFTRLVSRAWDAEPRVRPQIASRFAPRPPALPVEEREVEVAWAGAPNERQEPTMANAPWTNDAPDPLRVDSPRPAAPVPLEDPPRRARVEASEPPARSPPPVTLERTLERIFGPPVERTRVVETAPAPVAAPPPSLRAADVARLRPAAPSRPDATASAAARPPGAAVERALAQPPAGLPPIHVSIGRIDVRATAVAAAPAAPARSGRHTPLGLDDYLRRRTEER